jgi:hypothetical protein
MIVTSINTKQKLKLGDGNLEYGKPYAFSEEGEKWCVGERWPYHPTEVGTNALEMINPTKIRRTILEILE